MEIYIAISDFTPPVVEGSQNILEFCKGETFEIFDCHKTSEDWWGARALKDNRIGYVPSRYMQYEERKIEKLLPTDYKSQKEKSLKRLSDIQNSSDYKAPDQVMPETPVPDYDEAVTPQNESVFRFTEKFKNVLSSIQQIEDMYMDVPEPEPDYEGDETDFPQTGQELPANADENGLIQPKKLPNPCLESDTRQALHKELLLNYKRGVNVLEKPELNKVLKQRRETQRAKEWDLKASQKRTSLEMKLEQRANKLEEEEMETIKESEEKPEFQKVFAKITQKSNGQVK